MDGAGTLWFESGPPGTGLVTSVSSNASIVVNRIGRVGGASPDTSFSRMAADGRGGLLVATPSAILSLADGGLRTVAGNRQPEDESARRLGDGGPVSGARFRRIAAMATDGSGNVYVADEVDRGSATVAIRFLNRGELPVTVYPGTPHQVEIAPGTIETIAGAAGQVPEGPGRAPLVARGAALAVVGERLYLASSEIRPPGSGRVRMLNLGGRPLAAHGTEVAPAAFGLVATLTSAPGTGTGLRGRAPAISGTAADDQGNLFVADRATHRVQRVDAAGIITTFAGTGAAGHNGNDRAATQARLRDPTDVDVGPGGRVYISDAGNDQVRFVDQAGIIHAALGNGAADEWRCDRRAVDATVRTGTPVSVGADAMGNVYVAAAALSRAYRLSPSGAMRPVVGASPGTRCGDADRCGQGDGERAATADLVGVAAVAWHPAGGLYLLERNRIRFVNMTSDALHVHGSTVAPGTVRTVVGAGGAAPHDDRKAISTDPRARSLSESVDSSARRGSTRGGELVAGRDGSLVILDAGPDGAGRLRQLDARGTITILFDRQGSDREGGGADTGRCCTFPQGLALDRAGNLYVSDGGPGRVWFLNRGNTAVQVHGVTVAPGAAEAVAGSPPDRPGSPDDGIPALEAELARPGSLVLDHVGNLYIGDDIQHSVRRVDRRGIITTIAGSGEPGFNGDHLKGQLTALDRPSDVAIDTCGNLLIADSGNDRVRRLTLVADCGERNSLPSPASGRQATVLAAILLGGALSAVGVRVYTKRKPTSR